MNTSLLNNTQLSIIQDATKNGLLKNLEPFLSADENGKLHLSGRHLDLVYNYGIKYSLVPHDLCLELSKLNSKNKPIFKADYLFWIFRLFLIDENVEEFFILDAKDKPITTIDAIISVYNDSVEKLILSNINNEELLSDYMMLTQCSYFNESALKYVISNLPNRSRGFSADDYINYFDALELGTSCNMSIEYLEVSLKKDINGNPIFSPLQVQQIWLSGHFKVDIEVIANPKYTWEEMSEINSSAEKKLANELKSDFLIWFGQSWKHGIDDIPWMVSVHKEVGGL